MMTMLMFTYLDDDDDDDDEDGGLSMTSLRRFPFVAFSWTLLNDFFDCSLFSITASHKQ
jgi:hypothetical protein